MKNLQRNEVINRFYLQVIYYHRNGRKIDAEWNDDFAVAGIASMVFAYRKLLSYATEINNANKRPPILSFEVLRSKRQLNIISIIHICECDYGRHQKKS